MATEAINFKMDLTKENSRTKKVTPIQRKQQQQQPQQSGANVLENAASTSSSSVERYQHEWQQLLEDLKSGAEQKIRERAFNGELKVSKFRSVYWALLLRVLNIDFQTWINQREQQRRRYDRLKQEFQKNPHEIEEPDDNPLSQSTKSVWNQYFSDQELFAVIKQDVVRTFPGVDFFRKNLIQNAMCNVLFFYAREHPYMCYRQGMHEILAPILFVVYSDHQSLLHFMEITKNEVNATLLNVINPEFFEADTYSMFARLMSSIEAYYRITNLQPTETGVFVNKHTISTTEIEVIGQLNLIRDKILAKEDLHLHNYLLKLDIPLHIFGIRWLRLLFGREFPLLDLLLLWDAIFADSDCFNLPNYILVAMLIRIRDKLLLSDYTCCLTYLMRYPAKTDVSLILQHSLHMLMPNKFERPPNAFKYCTSQPSARGSGNKSSQNNLRLTQLENKSQRTRSTSLNGASNQIEQHITMLQTYNAADAANQARLSQQTIESDHNIIDGYSSNSPELLRLELKNAQTVISIARSKLQSYLAVIKKHTNNSKNKSEELAHALDGVEELCSLLDIRYMFPLHTRRAPIDQAFEANELKSRLTPEYATEPKLIAKNLGTEDNSENQTFASTSKSSSKEKQFLDGYAAYERPDDCINTTRLLGNRKEIELLQIATDEKIVEPLPPSMNTDSK